jgi:hypothetical protein
MATRELELVDANGAHVKRVVVKLYKPRISDDVGCWICNYRIVGIGSEELRYGAGEDSMQAVLLTLTKIGTDLYASAEGKAGLLRWYGNGNLGFPSFSPDVIHGPEKHITKLFV